MKPSNFAGIALLAGSCAAFAQQPMTLPGRSQSSAQQSVDNAACYAYANQTTNVNMARESQTPPKHSATETRTMSAPRPVEPPLPPVASGALAASAPAASGASAVSGASGASGAAVAGAQGASAAMPASAAMSASGTSDAIYGGDMKMPPLPPPEPPMVRYWRAYSECMQNRGYFVR